MSHARKKINKTANFLWHSVFFAAFVAVASLLPEIQWGSGAAESPSIAHADTIADGGGGDSGDANNGSGESCDGSDNNSESCDVL